MVLIPCSDEILDLEAISPSVDTAKVAGTPAAILFNCVSPRSAMLEAAQHTVKRYGTQIVPFVVAQRTIFGRALIAGQTAQELDPTSKAAEDIQQLYNWCIQALDK